MGENHQHIALEGKGLTLGYFHQKARKEVLNGLEFQLINGELTCLLGPNGVGKSTLINRMVAEAAAAQIARSLFGGLVLTVGIDNPHVKQIPVPEAVRCVLVHPHMVLATREARAILSKTVTLSDSIWQQANLAGFLAGCFTGDLPLIRL